MKTKLTIILLLLVSLNVIGQEKVLKQINDSNKYQYITYHDNGDVNQTGWYERIDGKLIRNGIWKDSNGTTVLYDIPQPYKKPEPIVIVEVHPFENWI